MLVTALYKSPEDIVAACLSARAIAPNRFPADLPPDSLIPDVPAWQEFERTSWGIGENIRQSLFLNPSFRKKHEVIQAILDVVQHRNLRRGRQSFVMLLGFTGAAKHAASVASFAKDPDNQGHVVDALLKMRAAGFASQVNGLESHRQAWIRRLAQRYIARYPAAA